MGILKKIWQGIKNVFTPSKPSTPVVTKPVETPPVETPVEVPTEPTQPTEPSTHIKDTVNDGNGKNPDWTYLWDNCELDAGALPTINKYVDIIVANKAKYDYVEQRTGVPWYVIAALHYREATLSWSGALHNGDPWTKKTVNVPAGRGPWSSWEAAAVDAIQYDKLDKVTDWSIYNALKKMETFNGLGYRSKIGDRGIVEYTPYVWAGTNQHDETSKYTGDGKYDKNAKEKQLGTAAILKGIELRGYNIKA